MALARPETRYAKLGEDRIAYQVLGEGPIDMLLTTGAISSVDARWDHPASAEVLRRLAEFTRLIIFDPRGSGSSDPLPADLAFGWETWVDDVRAVLDAAASEHAALFTFADAGPSAMLFAVTEPHRTEALILVTTTARYTSAEDYPLGFPLEEGDTRAARMGEAWGSEQYAAFLYPSRAGDARFLEWFARYQRAAASPRTIEAHFAQLFRLDVRNVLPLVGVPTLVISTANRILPHDHGRYLAERIAGARFVTLDTHDATPLFEDTDETIGVVEEFLTGKRSPGDPGRRLATVLFTDIVASTERAASLGDKRWREILDTHDRIVYETINRSGGRLVKLTGDGAFAAFDGPSKAIRCTTSLRDSLAAVDIDIRSGLHAGEVEMRADDVSGIAVHIAARVMSEAEAGQILASSAVKDLVVESEIAFADRGLRTLRGIPDPWRLYAVESV